MIENTIAANVLGVTGAVCWAIQLIPQIVVNYRRKHARGLQSSMMLLWASAGVPLGVYNISKNFNLALQIQPQILTFLSLVTFAQVKYYKARWSLPHCLLTVSLLLALLGSLELGLIFALRPALHSRLEWPLQLMAALSALLLALGVGRHYVDVWQHRDVRGISFLFVAVDAMGDLTSLLSLFFEAPFDYVGCVIYSVELVMWIGIMGLGVWYHFWPSERSLARARAEAEGEAGEWLSPFFPPSTEW
ncbi:PQ loop repeat-domain-containing protein [Leucosporidium creatinivorum]|uniref:PQ loop repeat-domain-containing protein n=1 Tax=Leucosporidium creatinivorum TaxID=106004 RepID=A0A1Y2F2B4_9BASI|nr:PQ loop repeat-domain-containing protein [Leucosporidium creatinivorum]